jgi:hypothetical protein
MLIITGDMNAKVGEQNVNYERVMGTHRGNALYQGPCNKPLLIGIKTLLYAY